MIESSEKVSKALYTYEKGSADYSDYLIALSNQYSDCNHTVSTVGKFMGFSWL
jgi:predicted nucleic-acid-binding protein